MNTPAPDAAAVRKSLPREPLAALALDVSQLPRGAKVLVACSGGADSTALLLALQEKEYSCVASHVNHGTREAESDADEQFIREVCERLRIPFTARKLEFPATAGEAELRDGRYAALLDCAQEYSCARIATGHTANDNLETVLLNWLRGASVAGFAGIPPARELAPGVLLVRPLLEATREQVRDFLRSRGEKWREDSSNESTQYLRNRVRRELLPLIAELGGEENRLATQTLQTARVWRDDLEFLEAAAQDALTDLALGDEEHLLVLDGLRFRELPVALQRRVLRAAAQRLEPLSRDIAFARVEEVRTHILKNERRAVWHWRKDLTVEWTGEYSGNRIRLKRV